MKKLFKSFALAALVFGAAACQQSDIDNLKRDVNDMEHRLKALETQVAVLNSNVEALQTLLSGATVNKVEENAGVYTVTLSNGDVLTLTQGTEGGYYTPVVSVDAEGYWTVSTDGTTFNRLTDANGDPVRAVAEDGTAGSKGDAGVTPKFKVDGDGYWTVSYDGGTSYTKVLDNEGNPVSATSGAAQDKFFADVTVADGMLTVEMLDGETYQIPIVSGFKCIISNDAEVVYFAQNETQTFDVDMKGVAATVITAPEGWSATLKAKASPAEGQPGFTLSVTAPEEAAKSRATADSRIDLSILAVSSNGLSTIAKMGVATNDLVLHTPTVTSVTVNPALTTQTSLTFSVVTDDANGWKYLCLPSTEAAPGVETVFTTGTAGAETPVTVSSLTHSTAYTIYVAAYYDTTTCATLGTASAKTAKGNVDYWETGVTIGGVTYDKNTAGAQLITATTTITANGVYFLDPAEGATISMGKVTVTNLVIIGRYSQTRVNLPMTAGPVSLGVGYGLVMKNVNYDTEAYNNYAINFATGAAAENMIFEDCRIVVAATKSFTNFNVADATVKNVEFNNSIIKVGVLADGSATRIVNFAAGKIADNGRVSFNNSIVYSSGFVSHGTLVHVNAATQTMPTVDIDVTNCSFINFIGQPNAFSYVATIKNINFSKNIFWANKSYAKESFTLKFWVADPLATSLTYTDNLVYGLPDTAPASWKYFASNSVYKPNTDNYVKAEADPFSVMNFTTEVFTPIDDTYGANL